MMQGQVFSHYRVIRKLGSGGMGIVYEAEDLRLGRHVALKFLPPEVSQDSSALERFQREARAASALNHPNLCTLQDIGETDDGRRFIVMELTESETLKNRISGQPLPDDVLIQLSTEIAAVLQQSPFLNIVSDERATFFWLTYLRGQAFLRRGNGTEASREFQRILDHRGEGPMSPMYPLAHLGLARAAVLSGEKGKSRKSYQDFLALWRDADPGIPILIEAKKEYASISVR
jgi:hypothetical protein